MAETYEARLNASERKLLDDLDSPIKIQTFLNSIPYSEDEFYRCPLRVLRERKAHCFDGALFAAMSIRRSGCPALILELIPNGRDDDHILAVFKQYGHWGSVAQSNFSGLRYREPIYRNLRELVMSYFEDFFNAVGEKTLVGYRGPINLKVFDHLDWMGSDAGMEKLSNDMNRYQVHAVIDTEMAANLSAVDERSLRAGMIGTNPAGLFKVK
jgi:hypothetical protein